MKVKFAQSCPTLCDPMDYAVHGILQARILEWVNFPFSRRSSQPRDRTKVSCIAGGFFTSCVTRATQGNDKLLDVCSYRTSSLASCPVINGEGISFLCSKTQYYLRNTKKTLPLKKIVPKITICHSFPLRLCNFLLEYKQLIQKY